MQFVRVEIVSLHFFVNAGEIGSLLPFFATVFNKQTSLLNWGHLKGCLYRRLNLFINREIKHDVIRQTPNVRLPFTSLPFRRILK